MRTLLACIGLIVLVTPALHGQDLSHYRVFELGSSVSAIAALADTSPSQVRIVHQRPAVIQELEWRPPYSSSGGPRASDPVAVVTFRFYNDQLFRIIVDYDRHRTSGMTDSDVAEVIAETYGRSEPAPGVNVTVPGRYGVADRPVATWSNAEFDVTLSRVAYPETFRLVLRHMRLDGLALAAVAEATRLDLQEAPQREIARRKSDADNADAAREKSRAENKAAFRP